MYQVRIAGSQSIPTTTTRNLEGVLCWSCLGPGMLNGLDGFHQNSELIQGFPGSPLFQGFSQLGEILRIVFTQHIWWLTWTSFVSWGTFAAFFPGYAGTWSEAVQSIALVGLKSPIKLLSLFLAEKLHWHRFYCSTDPGVTDGTEPLQWYSCDISSESTAFEITLEGGWRNEWRRRWFFLKQFRLWYAGANLGRHDLRLYDRLRRTMAWILLLIWRPSSRGWCGARFAVNIWKLENYCSLYTNSTTKNFP